METTSIISNIATAVSAVIAAVALLLTFLKYREKTKAEHAERMFNLLKQTRENPNTAAFFKMIDYSENRGWYNDGFPGSKFEQTIDNALLQFEHIMYLKEQKLLNDEEFAQYRYEIEKIVNNEDVQHYFFNLYHYSKNVDLPFKFDKLLNYGIENKYIDKDIYNKESKYFVKRVLNF